MPNTLSQTLLGFDFGTKSIGVAVGQTLTKTATPLCSIRVKQNKPDWVAISKIIKEWQPHALVIGIPLNMDGISQNITELTREFAKELEKRFQLPIYEIDERLTTLAAREKIFSSEGYKGLNKSTIDQVSAQIILENYLERL